MRHFLAVLACMALFSACETTQPARCCGQVRPPAQFDVTSCPGSAATGTLTFVQASRRDPTLAGSGTVTTVVCGSTTHANQLTHAALTETGQITFRLNAPNPEATWTFSGNVGGAGSSRSGTFAILAPGNTMPITEAWTAHKQ